MASGFLAKPGYEFGPCLEMCEHFDCQKTRSMAEQRCRFCGQPIGFKKRFYTDPNDETHSRLVHAVCIEQDNDDALNGRR